MESNAKEYEIKEMLQRSKAEKNAKQKQRYDAVLLYLEGYNQSEISAYLHIPKRTIRYYIDKYRKGSISALLIRKAPGAKKKLTDEQESELKKVISTQTPEEAGIGIFANWTAKLACEWVACHYHVKFSESGMRDLFYRIGLSYTRPTYTLKKADPQKQEKFREQFEGLKKGS